MSSMTSLHLAIEEAQEEWYKTHPDTVVQDKVYKILDARAEFIFAQLMGFRKDGWGRIAWEVDNCNGRQGESAVGHSVKSLVEQVLTAWIIKNKVEFGTTLDTQFKKSFLTYMKAEANRVMRYEVERQVKHYVEKAIEQALEDHLYNVGLKKLAKKEIKG